MQKITKWNYEREKYGDKLVDSEENKYAKTWQRNGLIILNYLTLALILGVSIFVCNVKTSPIWIRIVCVGFFIFLFGANHYYLSKYYDYNPLYPWFLLRFKMYKKNDMVKNLFENIFWYPSREEVLKLFTNIKFKYSPFRVKMDSLEGDYLITYYFKFDGVRINIYHKDDLKHSLKEYLRGFNNLKEDALDFLKTIKVESIKNLEGVKNK